MASLFSSVLLSLCLLSSPFLSIAMANAHTKLGFTADLIHRDSPKSPFYNPTETPSQRLRNAINRSVNRVVHYTSLSENDESPQTEITSNGGEYLMNVSLGTPPFPIMVIADTGSDLLWTQCKPCDECYAQEDPLFDPKASSTYKDVSCSSSQCALDRAFSCSTEENTCSYSMSYGDNSYTKGNVAADTLTLGSADSRPVQLKNIIIGCGHNNAGTFRKEGSGIVGLGGGAVSFVTQLGASIDGKFSYCLVPLSSENNKTTSKINFGTNAEVSGTGAVSTPLIKKSPATFYYLTLEAISVGSKKIEYSEGSASGTSDGNIIIDSGTTLTLLPKEFYSELENAVASSIDAERKQDPQSALSLCYSATSDLKVPVITMHFDGADVTLDSSNTFVAISEDLVCFAFRGSEDFAIYGNLSQMNFLVGYDTASKTVSFKPTDCANM